jgi:hypothetical protein
MRLEEVGMMFERRSFLSSMVVGLAAMGTLFAQDQQPQQGPEPSKVPSLPGSDAAGKSPVDEPNFHPDPKAQLKENQRNAKRDAAQLLQLAQELKNEVDRTNQTDVLSLPLIRKAEEIEKLARQIRTLARAS